MTEAELEELNVLRTKALLLEAMARKVGGEWALAWSHKGGNFRLDAPEGRLFYKTERECLEAGIRLILSGAEPQSKYRY